MKNLRKITLALFIGAASFSSLFTSCNSDPCKDIQCDNGGVCTEGSCDCPAGYEGASCETLSLSKFLGTNNSTVSYSFADNSGDTLCGNYTGSFDMQRSSADTTKLLLKNFGGFGTTTSVYGTVSGNTLTIPSQQIAGATTNTVSGTGTYTSGVITGSYTNNDGSSTCTYNFTWTKQ